MHILRLLLQFVAGSSPDVSTAEYSLNIGFNMLPSYSFMSCLYSLLGYSTGEFQVIPTSIQENGFESVAAKCRPFCLGISVLIKKLYSIH